MKTSILSLLSCLAMLLLFSSVSYSADDQISLKTSESGTAETSLVNLMVDLFEKDLEYRIDESSSLVLACSPFTDEQDAGQFYQDDEIYHPTSNISVGLKFSF